MDENRSRKSSQKSSSRLGSENPDNAQALELEEDEAVNEGMTFIDQQIDRHLKRYVRRRFSDLQVLRIRFQGDPFIPPTLTDEQLIVYLFAMHYNVYRTVSLLRSNYKMRSSVPSYFTARSVTDTSIQDVWNILKIGVFPKKTPSQQHIVLVGLRKMDPNLFKAHAVLKFFFMSMDVYYILEGLPSSVIVVLDTRGATHSYFSRDNYTHLKIAIKFVQESMPYNVEAVHVVNSNLTVRTVFKTIKPFLTKDIINMVHFHADNEMKQFLPERCLPTELGGTAPGSIDEYQENYRQRFEMMQEVFDMEEEQRVLHFIH